MRPWPSCGASRLGGRPEVRHAPQSCWPLANTPMKREGGLTSGWAGGFVSLLFGGVYYRALPSTMEACRSNGDEI